MEAEIELSADDEHVLMVFRGVSIAEDKDGELVPCCRLTPDAAAALIEGLATCLHRLGEL